MAIEPVTLPTLDGGMNIAAPPWEIADNELACAQDVFVAYDGYVRGRPPLSNAVSPDGNGSLSGGGTIEGHGIASTLTPDGKKRALFGHMAGGSSQLLTVWADNGVSALDKGLSLGFTLNATFPVWQAKPRMGGGVFIGIAEAYDSAAKRAMLVWNGARLADYSTGTVTYAQNSRTVTGVGTLWTTHVEPGMYLFSAAGIYLGMVVLVNSDTSITLDNACPLSAGAVAYSAKSFRGINTVYAAGVITTFTDNTTVLGADTHFTDIGLQFFTWNLYRASDGTFIGTVSSVANDTGLSLGANAAIALTEEAFFAVRTDLANTYLLGSHTPYTAPGFLTSIYQGRQWYGNLYYQDLGFGETIDIVSFSEEGNPERIDLGLADGSRIPFSDAFPGARKGIRGLEAAQGGLVVARDTATYAIVGDSPDNFAPEKITDDGCISAMTMVPYDGGVIWAGWNGVWFWAAGSPTNITNAKLGSAWQAMLTTFDPEKHRAWAFVYKDTYYVHVEHVVGVKYAVTAGVAPTNSNIYSVCYAIHMPTQTITQMTALFHHGGGLVASDFSGGQAPEAHQMVALLQKVDVGAQTTTVYFASMSWFTGLGIPNVAVGSTNPAYDNGNSPGVFGFGYRLNAPSSVWYDPWGGQTPCRYIETKHLPLGDMLRKKAWRSLLTMYTAGRSTHGTQVTTVLGPSGDYARLPVDLPQTFASVNTSSAVWKTVRQKFVRRGQYMGVGLLNQGDYTWGVKGLSMTYKWLPPGRP